MDNTINKQIGERIKKRRLELKLTQAEFAKRLNIKNRSAIPRYEKGEKTFKQSQIVALAEALETTPAYLMGWVADNNVIGNRIMNLRQQQHLTLYEMSQELHIDLSTLEKYENGSVTVPTNTLDVIADYLGVTLDELADPTEQTTHVTVDIEVAKKQERWFKELGSISFTDEELEKLIQYAKFLLSQREV